jgi:hypothetical protein
LLSELELCWAVRLLLDDHDMTGVAVALINVANAKNNQVAAVQLAVDGDN